ncbi:sensor histidine kinase [Dactylosporangium sp. CA-092794]|uniref:sensor histidine kinase n=1 Tax=Dactylosporangium sp. CA-092794 TaxID=3239929 RepID=UPI003D8D5B33
MTIRRARLFRRPATLRTRVTVIAGLALSAAIVLGLVFMYLLLVQSVHRTIDQQLRTYADQVAQSGASGRWPDPLPASPIDPNAQAQVLAPDGHVLASTRMLAGLPAVYALPAGTNTPVRQKAAEGVIPGEARVFAQRTTVAGRPVTIVTGTNTEALGQVSEASRRLLLLGLPGIVLVAAGTVWLVVGRALRPVERIRHTVTDITDITSADLSRRVPEPATADEIGHLAHTMNDMLARLEDAARRQRRFVADASHELRSPLAAIRTTLEVGLAHPGTAPWPVIADRAMRQAARLQGLVEALLVLAKADERQLAARQQRVDLSALLHEVAADTHTAGLDLAVEVPARTAVTGNPDQLRRLFGNLAENAARYARTGIAVTATVEAGVVRVDVDDDGPGIAEADRERVFDRFVRLDDSRGRGSGSAGLGLAIAREITVVHGGHIEIGASPAGGTRVTVTLPPA